MLRRFSVSNYRSFKEKAVLDLVVSGRDKGQGFCRRINDKAAWVSTAAGIFGANGSGKTALLRALDFVMDFATDSAWLKTREGLSLFPVMPWFNNAAPCHFILEWQDRDGHIYEYSLILDRTHIVSERLTYTAHEKSSRRDVWLFRQGNEIREVNGVFSGLNYDNLKDRASFIPMAVAQGAKLDSILVPIRIVRHFDSDYSERLPLAVRTEVSKFLLNLILIGAEKGVFLEKINDFLCRSDLGLSGIEVEEKEDKLDEKGQATLQIYGVHTLADGRIVRLPIALESEGTRVLLTYFPLIYIAFQNGTPLILDEFDAALHFSMQERILDMFDDPDMNPHGAQIIFATHSENLMNKLGKAHIYLAEKCDCESAFLRLDSLAGVRSSDNYSRKYLSGFYGGLPLL